MSYCREHLVQAAPLREGTDIRFEDHVVVGIKSVVYWSVTPYSLVSVYECFGVAFCFLEEEGSTFYTTGPVLMLDY